MQREKNRGDSQKSLRQEDFLWRFLTGANPVVKGKKGIREKREWGEGAMEGEMMKDL